MERGFGGEDVVEIGDELLDSAVRIPLKEMPIEAARFAPLIALGKFLAHEEEFLAGMRVLICIEQAEIGELLPHIAGHFVDQRVLAVNDFVMGKGKNKVFAERVDQRKGDFVVFVLAVDRIG